MKNHAVVCLLLVGCFGEPPKPDDGIGVTTWAPISTSDEGSSSSVGEPPAESFGPCAVNNDCPDFPSAGWLDGRTPAAICIEGRCLYSCPDNDVRWCPEYTEGSRTECEFHQCLPVECSPSEVDGVCCDEWCNGECYKPPQGPAECVCEGPGPGCPCSAWCAGTCSDPHSLNASACAPAIAPVHNPARLGGADCGCNRTCANDASGICMNSCMRGTGPWIDYGPCML